MWVTAGGQLRNVQLLADRILVSRLRIIAMAFVDADGLVHTDDEEEYVDGDEELDEYDDDEEIDGEEEEEYSEEEDGMVEEGRRILSGFGTAHA